MDDSDFETTDASERIRLSLCMIVRDNERTLAAALESVMPWVDEMVVVDTGSTDNTKQIAADLGAQVFDFPWCDDFSAARNESIRHAQGDWIFWMDSDDSISEDNGRKLRKLLDSEDAAASMGYVMQVHCGDGDAQGKTVVDHVKLFRNLPTIRFEGRIHEQVLPSIRTLGGQVGWTDAYVSHSGADYSPEGQARKLERDLRILNQDLKDRPDHPFVLFNLGMTHGNAGSHENAIDYFCRCIAASDTGESHLRKAYALLVGSLERTGQAPNAQRRCWEGLGRFPGDPELLFLSGTLAQKSGRLADAESAYQRILAEDRPRHFTSIDPGITGYKARQNLAVVLEQASQWRSAEEQWRAIVEEHPRYLPGWQGLADNLEHQGRLADIRDVLLAHTEEDQLGSLYPVLMARAAAARGELVEAKSIFAQALDRHGEDLSVRHAWCRHLFESEDPEAESALSELAHLDPGDASVPHNLGLACLKSERWEKSLSYFEQSLALRPDHVATLHYCQVAREAVSRAEQDAQI